MPERKITIRGELVGLHDSFFLIKGDLENCRIKGRLPKIGKNLKINYGEVKKISKSIGSNPKTYLQDYLNKPIIVEANYSKKKVYKDLGFDKEVILFVVFSALSINADSE
ncbi:MAG: hypothetical protein CMM93_06640 [Rickettsiales bacterium]|nr:hypothetical protein [Rickettsiales bacterium]|tara:strand:+ start:1519 stop:1848 length:330 start_codon:yes stop_codon:yes gene_type:complete